MYNASTVSVDLMAGITEKIPKSKFQDPNENNFTPRLL
jgi:hypothetical protein